MASEYYNKRLSEIRKKKDLKSVQGLAEYARSVGLEKEADKILGVSKKPKLSVLQRLTKTLGAFNPAEAYLTGLEKGVGSGVLKYGTGVAKGITSGITGRDYEGERRTFKDVAEAYGIKNGIAKFGIGVAGDILLDPSTYFGGAIAKGISKAALGAGKLTMKGIGKVSPVAEAGLKMTGTGLKDALGRAFVAGYKSTKGAQDDILMAMTKKSRDIFERASKQMDDLGVKGLTESQRMEVGLKTFLGKQSEFLLGEKVGDRRVISEMIEQAKKTGDFSKLSAIDDQLASRLNIKFNNSAQQQYFDLQQARIKELAEQADITDPYAIYFPLIRKDKLNKFIIDTQRKGISVGSEAYKKEFRNLLSWENAVKDPRQAFFTREAQIANDLWARQTLKNIVSKYGKQLDDFKNVDEARSFGYFPINEKGGFGKQVGWLNEWDKKLLTDLIHPEFQTINMLAKATGFDAITGLFKRSVTGLFLPFHIRNYMSGVIQNYETLGAIALDPKIIASGTQMAYKIARGQKFGKGVINVAGKNMNLDDVMETFTNRFGYGDATFIEDLTKAFDDKMPLVGKVLSKARAKETLKTVGLGREGVPFKVAREVGQFVEVQQKATAYLAAIAQGKSLDEALTIATRAGFDYRVLTRFESQIMRRLIPFYSFTRKNIELQLRTLGENPQRINQVIKLIENLGTERSDEDIQNLPDYLKQTLGISIGKDEKTGLDRYVSSFGTPIEAFTQLFKPNTVLNVISQMNPLLKTPIELGIGKDSFRQKDLKDVYDAKEYSEMPKALKDLLDIHEVTKYRYEMRGKKLVPVSSYTQYVADPKRLLIARSLFTSRGFTYLDNVFDKDVGKMSKFINLFTGIKAQPIDPEITKALRDKEQRRALEDLLIRLGEVKEFRTVYETK